MKRFITKECLLKAANTEGLMACEGFTSFDPQGRMVGCVIGEVILNAAPELREIFNPLPPSLLPTLGSLFGLGAPEGSSYNLPYLGEARRDAMRRVFHNGVKLTKDKCCAGHTTTNDNYLGRISIHWEKMAKVKFSLETRKKEIAKFINEIVPDDFKYEFEVAA